MGIFNNLTITDKGENGFSFPYRIFLVVQIKDFSKDDTFDVVLRSENDLSVFIPVAKLVLPEPKNISVPPTASILLLVPPGTVFSEKGNWFVEVSSNTLSGPIKCGFFSVVHK